MPPHATIFLRNVKMSVLNNEKSIAHGLLGTWDVFFPTIY